MLATSSVSSYTFGYQTTTTAEEEMIFDYSDSPFTDGSTIVYLAGTEDIVSEKDRTTHTCTLIRQMSEKEPEKSYAQIHNCSMIVLTEQGKIIRIWDNYKLNKGDLLILHSPQNRVKIALHCPTITRMTDDQLNNITYFSQIQRSCHLSPKFLEYLHMPPEEREFYHRANKKPSSRSCACTIM